MHFSLLLPLLIIFLDVVSFSFILPAITFIVQSFGYGSDYVGITISVTAIGVMLGGFIFGRLSDIFGRKNILLISLGLNMFGYLLFGLSNTLYLFIFARVLNGLGGGGMSVVQAYISDISDSKTRIVNMGYIGAAYGIGFVLGPIFGIFIAEKALHEIGIICAGIILFAIILTLFFFTPKKTPQTEKINTVSTLHQKYHFFFMTFSIMAVLLGLQTIFPSYLIQVFSYSMTQVYQMFAILGITIIVYLGGIFKYINMLFSRKSLFVLGSISIVVSLLIMSFNTNEIGLYAIVILFGLGFATINSIIFAGIGENIEAKSLGKVFGYNLAFASLGEIIGTATAGFIYKIYESYVFIYFALFFILAYSIFQVYIKKTKNPL